MSDRGCRQFTYKDFPIVEVDSEEKALKKSNREYKEVCDIVWYICSYVYVHWGGDMNICVGLCV